VSDDTIRVDVRVIGVERVAGAGRLLALADVEIAVDGLVILLHGVRIERAAAGVLQIGAPAFRHRGESFPAIDLPPELSSAIADTVIDQFRRLSVPLGLIGRGG